MRRVSNRRFMKTPTTNKIIEILLEIKEDTAVNTAILSEHIRRTEAAEKRIELLQQELNDRILPIEQHVQNVQTAGKIIAWISGTLGTLILTILGWIASKI